MKKLLLIALLIVGCEKSTAPDSDRLFTISKFLILATGYFDTDQLNPFGYTNESGYMEFTNKTILPTMFDTPTLTGEDQFGNITGTFTIYDYTTGNVDIIVKDTLNDLEWTISDVNIIDGTNIIDITSYGKQHVQNYSGNFKLIFNDNNEREGLAIYLQYVCNPESSHLFVETSCSSDVEEGGARLIMPTTTINFAVPQAGKVSFTISYLDGTIYDHWGDEFMDAGSYSIPFEYGEDDIDAGIQFFRYTVSIDYHNPL